MYSQNTRFQKKLIAAAVASCALSGTAGALAQETGTPQALEEVVVVGVRGAQESAINTKRDATSVVDGISAEDIGKLPDVTIADSLQRISGVQIRRSAGEGSSINVRGLPQVVTQLNGEQYLGANSVVSTQPNFNDIPSQLFKGAEVYKSSTANLGNAGITGTVNLKTYRPFDFDSGITTAGSVELQHGTETQETDPSVSGLFNWNNDGVGFLFAATYANVNLSNSYNGINTSTPGDAGWTSQVDDESLGMADMNRLYMGAQGLSAWNQVTERERVGLNSSFQADLGDGFTLTTDWFYTSQEEYNRKVGLSATNKWQGDNWFTPTSERATGATIPEDPEQSYPGHEFYSWQTAELSPKRLKSFTQNDVFETESRNINIQLDYDNGGRFTGSFRAVIGEAERTKRHGYNEGDLTNGTTTGINPLTWTAVEDPNAEGYTPPGERQPPGFFPAELCGPDAVVLGAEGGCFQSVNPLGYSENPMISYDTTTEHPTWGGFDRELAGGLGAGATVRDYMANLESYNVGAFSSENNEDSKGTFEAFSLKGSYELDDTPFVTSVDVGLRSSKRTADFERFNIFSPVYDKGCEVQWKATDVQLHTGECQDGELVSGELNGYELDESFVGYTALPRVPLDQYNNVQWVTDFGPVNGIPGVWATDPADYDDPIAFHERVFGAANRHMIPGSSFNVGLDELSYYVQANFEQGNLSGNLGVRVVETDLTVKQNIAGDSKPYGNTNIDTGDIQTKRDYTDVLPSLNMAYNLTEDMILRFAYTEAMTPLDLNQYGEGLALNYTLDSESGSPTEGQFIVSDGSLTGNPNLNPWRSNNLDLSWEWYLGAASMLSVGAFSVDIESFTETDDVRMEQPDADGVVRRSVNISTLVQGDGGTLEGVELGAKLAFSDFLDTNGVLSNFGMDTNYTYSPSEGSETDIYGEKNMFPDNSEHQFNLIGWYQADRFQARIAYNYRSERLVGPGAWGALNLYQDEAAYVDMSASYDFTDEITVYVNGSNVTGEYEDYYLEFEDQYAFQNYYEPRYAIGVRARF